MKTFNLNVAITAYTSEEAEAKLQFLLLLESYISKMEINGLAESYLHYQTHRYVGKMIADSTRTSSETGKATN